MGRHRMLALFLAIASLPAAAATAEEPRALTPADKKEMERIVREFVDADDAARAKLVEAAAGFTGIAAKDFAPIADKLLKLKRKYLPAKGGADRTTLTLPDGQSWSVQVRTPGGYVPGKPIPALFFLHGVKGYDRAESWIDAGPGAGFLTVTPLAPSGWWDRGETDALFFFTLRWLRRNYSVDGSRVFLAGFNQGGNGSWYYGLRYPQLFAGLGPMAGNPLPGSNGYEQALHLPVFAWHGEKDEDIPPEGTRKAIQGLQELGFKPVYKEIPGGLTCDWYFKDLGTVQKEMLGAFAKLKRPAGPDKVMWVRRPPDKPFPPSVPWPDGCWWIEVGEADKTAKVAAEKAGKNKFKLTTEGVKKVTVLLNAGLADLAAPVEIEWDGKPAHAGPVLCSLPTLLRTWGRYEDPELAYSAEVALTK